MTFVPQDEAELVEIIRSARGPLRVQGGGTRDIGRPFGGDLLLTKAMHGITLYEPESLTLVVRAGTPMSEVTEVLATHGQRLAFEPMDHRGLLGTRGMPTIGGVAAANVSGPRRIQSGAARDSLMGIRAVDGTGTVIRNGGRVMKNVTGYDLVKLLAGSWGTLAVLTELSFKVQSCPETEATVILSGLSLTEAVGKMSAALGSPFDVSGAAHDPADGGRTCLRLEGMAGSVAYRTDRLCTLLGKGDVLTGVASAACWEAIRDVAALSGQEGAVWRISVKPSDGPALVEGLGGAALFDWGGGLVWLRVPDDGDAGAGRIRDRTARLGGHATLIRASAATRGRVQPFPPEPAAIALLSKGLRSRFDPRGILNPGLMD
jgi:glycolate oxidase FAD binding subunit